MLRGKKRSEWEKADQLLAQINKDFASLGRFLEVLFYNRISGVLDPRTNRHVQSVAAFLNGTNNVTMGTLINLLYNHPQSRAPSNALDYSLHFSPPDVASPRDIDYARPALSTWALQTVVPELRRQVWALTQNDPSDPIDATQLRATTNGRAKNVRLATWDAFGRVSIPRIASAYKRRAPAAWYATEGMGAPTRRPHNAVQVGVLSCLALSRNRYASGYLALPLAVWQFACKTHVDEKRIFSRFGFTVHDTTARACLNSLTDSSLAKLRESVAEGIANGTMYWQIVLDNIQQYCRQRDHRLGRQDVLKVGTAATAILLEDCAPGAFNLQDHLDRVMKQERRQLTIDALYADIDWKYIHELTALLWVRILVHFIPQLAYLRQDVAALFNSDAMTKHRLPKGRITVMQPVGTNAEHSTETQGMMRAMLDFEGQMGLDEQAMEGLIFMPRGDGASIAAIWRIKKYLSAHPEHYKAFRNRVPPGPEIFHTRWTQLNAMSNNSYGPASSSDPSALSKRPSNLKKVDFFPTSRSMKLFFEARVLDCWRQCVTRRISRAIEGSRILVRRYASQQAYAQALNQDFVDSANVEMKIPLGTPWVSPVESSRTEDDEGEGEPEDNEADPKRPSVHVEADDFMGDRVVANEALFLQDMGWWILVSDAVPTIWILSFCGSGNRNYTNYLLETYCLHRYEASKDFSNAMLTTGSSIYGATSISNATGSKRILTNGSKKWWNTRAAILMTFLQAYLGAERHAFPSDEGEDGNCIRPHASRKDPRFTPPEKRVSTILRMHKEDQLHLFRPGRSMGHAAVNFFERGYEKLEDTQLTKFIRDSTAYADITKDVLDGQEHDDWDEEQQRKYDQMQQIPARIQIRRTKARRNRWLVTTRVIWHSRYRLLRRRIRI
ncbi:hypothetical protein B0H10DRAFT_2293130 [Mycena sp. CBHHK59/15]|nr:hypothetical protein B0H10DRAFT_2293130 [Mycena sp. CBHHK59/15]